MSRSTALGVTPDQRPVHLAEFRNAYGLAPSIWPRLLTANGLDPEWMKWTGRDVESGDLEKLWRMIDDLPDWQQVPLLLTFDTGVIPADAFAWAADQLDEFDRRCPRDPGKVDHVPAIAQLLRNYVRDGFHWPYFGMWGTSVSENPFDPWDDEADAEGNGIPLEAMYLLARHR